MIRKLAIAAGLLCVSWQASGAVVTYTMMLHQNAAGQSTNTNQFAVYATVEQGTSDGLFAFGVDLEGTFTALTNKTPNGFYAIDDTSATWDSTVTYPPPLYLGWGAGRGASISTGVVSGVPDLNKDPNLVRIFKFGQQAGSVTPFKPPDFVNPPDAGEHPNQPVPWKYNNDPGADLTWGNPPNPAGGCSGLPLPAGTVRLATGTWTGSPPTIGAGVNFPNTKASVWRLSHPNGTENDIATVAVQTRDFLASPALDSVSLSNTAGTNCSGPLPNLAVGGSIRVTGANNSYVSEVDALISDSSAGAAPIQSIGDEAGSIYVMAKLNGTAADIAAFLGVTTADVQEFDPQFALLHAAYDAQFGPGGFNALFKFNNFVGTKVFSIDASSASHGLITIDALAAVPEPGAMGLMAAGAVTLLLRKRRLRMAGC